MAALWAQLTRNPPPSPTLRGDCAIMEDKRETEEERVLPFLSFFFFFLLLASDGFRSAGLVGVRESTMSGGDGLWRQAVGEVNVPSPLLSLLTQPMPDAVDCEDQCLAGKGWSDWEHKMV